MPLGYPIRERGNFGNSSGPSMSPGNPSQNSRNVPRYPRRKFGSAQPPRQQFSGASCEACYDMNPSLRPPARHTKLDLKNEIKVTLPKFLEASENNQCPFCTVLLEIFLGYVHNAEEKVSRAQSRRNPLTDPTASVLIDSGKPVEIRIREGIGANEVFYDPILLYGPAEGVSYWPNLSPFEDPDRKVDESFQFFQNQIEHCVQNHSDCVPNDQRSLPKRLLDIGTSDRSRVKLVDSDDLDHGDRRYATVSHRWCEKDDPMLMTKEESKDDHYALGIPRQNMPGVLIDAIKVTRTLGLRYLWMDSLCMIQDNEEDMEEELPQMGTYYANAYFTIAASSSANTKKSFLKPRDRKFEPQEFRFGEDEDSSVHVRTWGAEGNLANRGWTWQESAQSTRVLNFAPSECIWECKSEVISECGFKLRDNPSLGLARKFLDVENRPLERWQELVQSYSARKLTKYTDVLPAISGLAQRVKQKTGFKYYAGIWREEMATGLLWEVARDFTEQRASVPVEYTAPSWSWASVQGRVRTGDTDMGSSSKHASYRGPEGPIAVDRSFAALTPAITIGNVECTVPLYDQNEFGKVTDGSIELIGRLISVTLTWNYKDGTRRAYMLEHPGKPGNWLRFSADTELGMIRVRQGQSWLFSARRTNSTSGQPFKVPVECLLIAKGPGARPGDVTLDGIVLGRSQTDWNQRKRIGFFSFSDASWFAGATYDQKVTIV